MHAFNFIRLQPVKYIATTSKPDAGTLCTETQTTKPMVYANALRRGLTVQQQGLSGHAITTQPDMAIWKAGDTIHKYDTKPRRHMT